MLLEIPSQLEDSVRCFLACQPTYLAGVAAVVPIGIAMQERESALRIRGVPTEQWSEINADIQFIWDEFSALVK